MLIVTLEYKQYLFRGFNKGEWDDFWETCGDDWYHDEDDVPDDVDNLERGDRFSFTGGTICWQGSGEPRSVPGVLTVTDGDDAPAFDLVRSIRKWQKSKDRVVVSIEIPRDNADALVAAAKKLKGRRL